VNAHLRCWIGALSLGCSARVPCDVPASCDVRAAPCQQQAMRAAACLRGSAPADVPVRVLSADRYIQEQVQMAADEPDAELAARWFQGLALLELADPGLDAASATRAELKDVAAFYSPRDKRVTLLDRDQDFGAFSEATLLVHEFVHALQDRDHDLSALEQAHTASFDSSLGLKALIEGEAEIYQVQALALIEGYRLSEVSWNDAWSAGRTQALQDTVASESPIIVLPGSFAYRNGASYAYAAYRQGGPHAIDAAFAHPPESCRQVMVGYGAGPPGGESWIDGGLDAEAAPQLQQSWQHVRSDHLGSYALAVFVRLWNAYQAAHDAAVERALLRLRGDLLSVFASADGAHTMAVWRLRFASATDASAIALIAGSNGRTLGDDAVIAIDDSGAWPLAQDVAWGPAPAQLQSTLPAAAETP
jgi:hypothetical protein